MGYGMSLFIFLLPSASLQAFFIFLMHTFQDDVAGCFEYYAELAEALDGKQKTPVSLPMQTFRCYVSKEPVGVVGLITPWYVDVYMIHHLTSCEQGYVSILHALYLPR